MRRPRLYLWTAGLNADLSVVTAVEGLGERDPPWTTSFGSEARWVPCWDCCTASTFIGSRLRVLWPSVRQAAKQKASIMAFGRSKAKGFYYGFWAFVLWTLFGAYVLAFWILAYWTARL